MLKTSLSALAAIAIAGTAQAADRTPTEIVNRHIAGAKQGVDAIMEDFADDAIVLQQGRAIQGKAAIRELFAKMLGPRPAPAGAPPAGAAPPGGGMKVTRIWEDGNVGFDTWEAGPMHATEAFIVKNGKIQVQTIWMTMGPPPPPGGPGAPPPPPPPAN